MPNERYPKLTPDFLRGRLLLSAVIFICLGIFIGYHLHIPADIALLHTIVIFICALLVQIILRRVDFAYASVLALSLMLGIFLVSAAVADLAAFPAQDGDTITISGYTVGNSTDLGNDKLRLRIRPEQINGIDYRSADIYLYIKSTLPVYSNSKIAAVGEVFCAVSYNNGNAFDYNSYLQRQGIAGSVSTYFNGSFVVFDQGSRFSLWGIGSYLLDKLEQAASPLSAESKALLFGVFIGDKRDLDYQTKQILSLSGSLHAFAVSGLHVGYVLLLACTIVGSSYRRRRLRLAVSIVFLLIYISMTGPVASVLRASLMGICLLLGGCLNEKSDSCTNIAAAALICLVIRPLWLFDAGFQLSFAAAFGIIMLLPVMEKLLSGLPRPIAKLFAVTFAASLAVLPLISCYFYHISWLGWLISPAVIMAAGVAVILCFCATGISLFSIAIAAKPLAFAGWLMQKLYALANLTASVPFAVSFTGAPLTICIIGYYAGICCLPHLAARGKLRSCTLCIAALLVGFSIIPSLIPAQALTELPQQIDRTKLLEVVFLDVGQGDCALLIMPDHSTVLIDGGGKESSPGSIGENVLLPYLKSRGISSIDTIICSHTHADHADGLLTVLDNLPVKKIIKPPDGSNANEIASQLADKAKNIIKMGAIAGDTYDLTNSLTLSVFAPSSSNINNADLNESSLICKISYDEIDFLFTGDATATALTQATQEFDLASEIVKMPHHGSDDSFDENFYNEINPEAIIFSVGAHNNYGHPAIKVIEYWQNKCDIYRTDINGAITVYTDGKDIFISTETEQQ